MGDLSTNTGSAGRLPACHTTPRLKALADMVGCESVVADIGCDHAYLSILLVQSKAAGRVIASDVAMGPVGRARSNIEKFGLGSQIVLRLGDGLSTLRAGEAGAIVIAGMGGRLIAQLLDDGADIARQTDRLILQPMTDAPVLRRYLYENGYAITAESLAAEKNRFYHIIQAGRGPTQQYSDFDCHLSPALMQSAPGLLLPYLKKRQRQLESILRALEKSPRQHDLRAHYQTLLTDFTMAIAKTGQKQN